MTFTLVSFHAHPDDEALLTAGTLARVAAEGHRVVLVVATAGEAGLAGQPAGADLGRRREAELRTSAAALGCARVELLGYPDSGFGAAGRTVPIAAAGVPFAELDPAVPARRLADILLQEGADVLTGYDPAGGYGHPDHLQVHRVAELAAELAGTPVLLAATVDRDALVRVAGWLSRVPGLRRLVPDDGFRSAYTPRAELTHVVDVTGQLAAKRAALRAHASQATGGAGLRTVALLARLPGPLFRRVLGREWYVERGRTPGRPVADVFASLRPDRPA